MINTHYDTLQVSRHASFQDIKGAYRKLCFIYHPDRCTTSYRTHYEEKLKKINQAYAVLSDATLRQEYDRKLDTRVHGPTVFEYGTVKNPKRKKPRRTYRNKFQQFIFDIYNTIKYEEKRERKILLIIGLLFVLAQPLYGIGVLVSSYIETKQTVLNVTRTLINAQLDTSFKTRFTQLHSPGE